MEYFIRKIELSKWRQNDILNGEEVSADAVTNCLKTSNNTLSIWKVTNTEEIIDAVIALTSQCKHLDTIDIIILTHEDITKYDLSIKQTPGITAYTEFINNHYDIKDLDYKSLGKIINIIISHLQNDDDQRFTRGKLKTILKEAINDGKISVDHLSESLVKSLS